MLCIKKHWNRRSGKLFRKTLEGLHEFVISVFVLCLCVPLYTFVHSFVYDLIDPWRMCLIYNCLRNETTGAWSSLTIWYFSSFIKIIFFIYKLLHRTMSSEEFSFNLQPIVLDTACDISSITHFVSVQLSFEILVWKVVICLQLQTPLKMRVKTEKK